MDIAGEAIHFVCITGTDIIKREEFYGHPFLGSWSQCKNLTLRGFVTINFCCGVFIKVFYGQNKIVYNFNVDIPFKKKTLAEFRFSSFP